MNNKERIIGFLINEMRRGMRVIPVQGAKGLYHIAGEYPLRFFCINADGKLLFAGEGE